jgi:hypothetical protein
MLVFLVVLGRPSKVIAFHMLCMYCFDMKIAYKWRKLGTKYVWQLLSIYFSFNLKWTFWIHGCIQRVQFKLHFRKYKRLIIATHITCLIYTIPIYIFNMKIIQIFLSIQNMWNAVTFHGLPNLRWCKQANESHTQSRAHETYKGG